jgi:hypothetical protein
MSDDDPPVCGLPLELRTRPIHSIGEETSTPTKSRAGLVVSNASHHSAATFAPRSFRQASPPTPVSAIPRNNALLGSGTAEPAAITQSDPAGPYPVGGLEPKTVLPLFANPLYPYGWLTHVISVKPPGSK